MKNVLVKEEALAAGEKISKTETIFWRCVYVLGGGARE
jgi:hypothetical protein